MEFTLKGMPFDSLRVVAYDNTKNEIVHFPCRLTHSDTWINEIPDSIWDTNDIFVLGKGNEIQKKYGQKIRIKIYHPENWATIESLDPDVKVREVLREFDLPDYDEQLREATVIQDKFR